MKSLQHLSFIGFAIMLVLASCTAEKRLYMPGYHTEWKNGKHHSDNQELVSYNNSKGEQNEIVTFEQSENETKTIDNVMIIMDETITASADDKQIILPQNEKINLLSSHKIKTLDEKKQSKPIIKSEFKKVTKLFFGKINNNPLGLMNPYYDPEGARTCYILALICDAVFLLCLLAEAYVAAAIFVIASAVLWIAALVMLL